jgi:uroporphyrinogen decarboxylase
MIFDSWGGTLTEELYLEFSLPYIQQILSQLNVNHNQATIPSIVFTKGGGVWLPHLAKLDASVLGIDWSINIGRAKKICGNKALQGNLDPVILAVGDKAAIKKEVTNIIGSYVEANNGKLSGHIFNLGHGILPITNPDSVSYLVDTVHEISGKFI